MEAVESALKEAGFFVSQPCLSRPSCFDLAARKGEFLVLVKIQSDIGIVSTNDLRELGAISQNFFAVPLMIGEKSRDRQMQDDTVYTRHDISAVTTKTFENFLLNNNPPLIQASPGGYYVKVDGDALKRRRQELGLSAGDVAELVNISRRTIYGYERGMAKASVTAAYNLIWALGIPFAKPINILEHSRTKSRSRVITTAKRMLAKNKILGRIFGRYIHYHVITVSRAPFDFLISVPKLRTRIIGGIANTKEGELCRRIDEILSIGKVVRAQPILITEGQDQPEKGILCIRSDNTTKIKNPADLIASVK